MYVEEKYEEKGDPELHRGHSDQVSSTVESKTGSTYRHVMGLEMCSSCV